MKNVYFLSDAHLGSLAIEHGRTKERRLVHFLDSIKDKAGAVYLLGDMFDFWYEYKYVVNGTDWYEDPESPDYVPDPYGGRNSKFELKLVYITSYGLKMNQFYNKLNISSTIQLTDLLKI